MIKWALFALLTALVCGRGVRLNDSDDDDIEDTNVEQQPKEIDVHKTSRYDRNAIELHIDDDTLSVKANSSINDALESLQQNVQSGAEVSATADPQTQNWNSMFDETIKVFHQLGVPSSKVHTLERLRPVLQSYAKDFDLAPPTQGELSRYKAMPVLAQVDKGSVDTNKVNMALGTIPKKDLDSMWSDLFHDEQAIGPNPSTVNYQRRKFEEDDEESDGDFLRKPDDFDRSVPASMVYAHDTEINERSANEFEPKESIVTAAGPNNEEN
eukprot:c10092_g1_i2.p1 GENE.c10092_g1_i2~~c10092_g1_i2.p1  ORF type:complete len:269 (-),score=70.49 c10092_g1_i2:928-1734(-)